MSAPAWDTEWAAEWCAEGGERPETGRKFNARLKERGQFEGRRSGPGGSNEWHGLRLLKKQNLEFAGKLKHRSENTHNTLGNTSTRDKGENSFSSSVASVEPTEDQERRVRKLVYEGMAGKSARAAVLGKCPHGVPKGYPCDDCDVEQHFGGRS